MILEPKSQNTITLDAELDGLLDLEGVAREERLRALEGLDAARGKRLRAWLEAIERSEGYFESPLGRVEAAERVGPWRVLRLIGQGGMGEVYLGERADGAFSRRVAIKFLRPGRGTVKQLARERQVLARLRHAGIAQLLDGGVTEGGRPYLVMEWVDGLSLDRWVAERKPGLRARVEVLRQVAQAVSYAHANLVIHRDLKPANVMVDGSGSVRLLDFGIARLLEEPAGQMLTEDRALTPELAAPEQFLGQGVSTRTDVYALGGLLYWLVSGRFAHDSKGLALADLVQRVCHEDPQAPSALAGGKVDADLDAIVLTALARDPERRYASAEALERDLGRWLAGETVSARLPGAWERGLRFARRHKIAVGLTAAVFVSLVAGITSTLWQMQQAQFERDEAELRARQEQVLLIGFGRLFRNAEAEKKFNPSEWLELAAQQADAAGFADNETKAVYLEKLADIELWRAQPERALLLHERILTRHANGLDPASRVQVLCQKAWALASLDRYPEADRNIEEGLAIAQSFQGSKRRELLRCLNYGARISPTYLFDSKINTQRLQLAFNEWSKLEAASNGDVYRDGLYMQLLSAKADELSGRGQYAQALEILVKQMDNLKAIEPKLGIDAIEFRATTFSEIATLLDKLGELRIADAFYDAALKTFENQRNLDFSPYWKRHFFTYSRLKTRRGDYATAIALAQRAIELQKLSSNLRPRELGLMYQELGYAYGLNGEYDRAQQALDHALDWFAKVAQDFQERRAYIGLLRAGIALERSQTDRAKEIIQPLIGFYQESNPRLRDGTRLMNLSRALQIMARTLMEDDPTLAATYARDALTIEQANPDSSPTLVALAGLVLAEALLKSQQRAQAIPWLMSASVTLERAGHRRASDALALLLVPHTSRQ